MGAISVSGSSFWPAWGSRHFSEGHGPDIAWFVCYSRLFRWHVIYSDTWEQHLQYLQEVLRRLQQASLTINPLKCAVAWTEIEYLGYIIDKGVVRPQMKKVQVIQQCLLPQTREELRSFLDMAGFYNRFIPNFSGRAAALMNMVGLRCPNWLQWSEKAMMAF